MRTTLTVIILLTLICPIYTDANEAVPEPSKIPLAMMQKLNVLAGLWLARTDITNDNGQTWQNGAAKKVSINFKQKGLLLEELPLDISARGFHMQTYISYDQYRQVFRKAAIDDVWGIMDLYQGSIINSQLVLDNLSAKTFFPISDSVWRGFKLTIDLKADNRWIYIDKTDDDGKSWQPAFRVHYQKINE